MPKKSKKSKSKRTTLKQKYKVIKKVKEHHKKKAKLDKKLGRKAKKVKDPGIPGQWPFKQDLLKELEWEKQRAAAEQKRKKEERRLARANAAKEGDDEMADGLTMEEVQTEAAARQRAFESQEANASTSGRGAATDNSRRAFYKEFVKVVEAADVIIEVLDARDPLSTRCTDVERYVRKSGASKKLILLLNKIDLVPREAAEAWLKYLREELPTVAFRCSTQKQRENVGQRRGGGRARDAPQSAAADHGASGSACLGADMLLQLLKKYSLAAGMKQAITVGVVGLPNVGKSSLINSLKRKHAAATGNTPGVTTTVQEVHLDKKVTLLDSPGIVFSAAGNAHAALLNCTKVEQIEDPLEPAAEVVRRCEQRQLMTIYRVGAYSDAEDLLRKIATARGKLKPGGIPMVEAAAKILLHDWNDGRIPFFTMPPQRTTHGHAAAAVMPSWSQDFNVDEAFAEEQSAMLADLPSVEDGNFTQTQAGQAPSAALEAMEMDEGLRRMSDDENDDEDSEDEGSSGMSKGEAGQPQCLAGKASEAATVAAQQQAVKLYQEEGQFNPHAARSQRKQAKKSQRRHVSLATKQAADEEFDFAEAFDNVAVGGDED